MSCVCRLMSSCHEIKVWKALNNMACAAGLGAITGVLPKEYYQHAINALDQAWALILHDTAVAAGSFFQTSKADSTKNLANCESCTYQKHGWGIKVASVASAFDCGTRNLLTIERCVETGTPIQAHKQQETYYNSQFHVTPMPLLQGGEDRSQQCTVLAQRCCLDGGRPHAEIK